MKEYELKNLRRRREKHFLQKDGSIIAKVYDDDVHFLKDGKFEEIDNTLIKAGEFYTNKDNEFHVYYNEKNHYLSQINKGKWFLYTRLYGIDQLNFKKESNEIIYSDVLQNVDFKYKLIANKLKESIIIKDRPTCNKITFIIDTNLNLYLKNNKIIVKNADNVVFTFDKPYMYDSNNKFSNNIIYTLEKLNNTSYKLVLIIDELWLNSCDYPVVVDPTITSESNENSVYDTYIYPGDSEINKNTQDILKVGVERKNGVDFINRTLIKFDLPTIATGSQIIDAQLLLVGYPVLGSSVSTGIVNIHQVTEPWDEEEATWNNMHDKFKDRLEGSFDSFTSSYVPYPTPTVEPTICTENITSIVKKWYAGEENYGLMLMANTEVYVDDNYPKFFSKNNTAGVTDPKPLLIIKYRNQNGLENYMEYFTQLFSKGASFVNLYNGNLTCMFDLISTISNKFPAEVLLYYNTNDVILSNDFGFGKGFKLNYNQTIKEIMIDGIKYMEYLDSDGTIHYFKELNGIYKDEDGLNMTVQNNDEVCTLTDAYNNRMFFTLFNNVWYLTKITDVAGNSIYVFYENNKIIKIKDSSDKEINILYFNDYILINGSSDTIKLNLLNNKIVSIDDCEGRTFLTYDNEIIRSIKDINGKKYIYEYYKQIPYRIKKFTEFGLNDVEGKSFILEYNYNSTTIIDNKNRASTMTFNDLGNVASISTLNSKEDIKDAYGNFKEYGKSYMTGDGEITAYKNKLFNIDIPYKYVKNYLYNTSFEQNDTIFNNSDNIITQISNEEAFIGKKSLKVVNEFNNQFITKMVEVPKGDNYTFSCYIKNSNKVRIAISYIDFNNSEIEEYITIPSENNEFMRYDVTINYPLDAISPLIIKMYFDTAGISYVDCIQLEKGEVANSYNLLENSDFSTETIDWDLSVRRRNSIDEIDPSEFFEIATLKNGMKALHLKMKPENSSNFRKKFDVVGKAGDKYNISFWYKNTGFFGYDGPGPRSNNVIINFNYIDEDFGHCISPSGSFNTNENEWQFFSATFVAEKEFDSISVTFFQDFNANDLYITNISLIKDLGNVGFAYDENGNLFGAAGLNNQEIKLDYDNNNQIVQMVTPNGKFTTYEYDRIAGNRLINSAMNSGIVNEMKYNGVLPVVSKTSNKNVVNDLENGIYKIRLKGTDKYLSYYKSRIFIKSDRCNHNLWIIQKENNYYKIKHSILNKYLQINNNLILLSDIASLFSIEKTKIGTYLIKSINEDKYFYVDTDNILSIHEYIEDNHDFEFAIETIDNELFIELDIEYDEFGGMIKSITDPLMHKTIYNVNRGSGLLESIVNAMGEITTFDYNDKKQMISMTKGNRSINYNYNNQGLISNIIQGEKNYKIDYDEFSNIKSIKIGDGITLFSKSYEEKNGKLLSVSYGNNHIKSYEYDKFDKLIKISKMNDVYNFKYDNNGNLAKLISNNDVVRYKYNIFKQLCEYNFNDFTIKYEYDKNKNVIKQNYILDNINSIIVNDYDENDMILRTTINNLNKFNYKYDYLGRLINNNVDNQFNIDYEYVTNGKRTSLIIKSININGDVYSYNYNRLNNLTSIYHNNILENKYYYNEFEELIQEDNYVINRTIIYTYDDYGNLLCKKTFNLGTDNLLSIDKYEYENKNWKDQLTRFNDEVISYDAIGNPTKIGTKIFKWINGKELESYSDTSQTINYKYNNDSIRTSKIVNNVETKYYLEGTKIIFEKTGDNILYFMWNSIGDLLGFMYNNEIYYYMKNNNNDIIGILDVNKNIVAKYSYDSWGSILSILDENNNDIMSNKNHIANKNPFRYRGYYYDSETNLYYLNSRYYNPAWGRFLNADNSLIAGSNFGGLNLYCYANNNPIMNIDMYGASFFSSLSKAAKTVAKKVVKTVTTVAKKVMVTIDNTIKSAKQKLYNVVDKAKSNIHSIMDNSRFVFEVGRGAGYSFDNHAGIGDFGFGDYRNYDVTRIVDGNMQCLDYEVKSFDVFVYGSEKRTEYFYDCETHIPEPKVEMTSTSFGPFTYTADGKLTAFFGFEQTLHFMIGGSIKIGIEIEFN